MSLKHQHISHTLFYMEADTYVLSNTKYSDTVLHTKTLKTPYKPIKK